MTHDPSGLDMTRDNQKRLSMFTGESVEIRRIALNMPQIEQYSPPPNPAKVTDSRAQEYIARHGETSWELDALTPSVIGKLIEREISKYVDMDAWDATARKQARNRQILSKISDNAEEVFSFVENEL